MSQGVPVTVSRREELGGQSSGVRRISIKFPRSSYPAPSVRPVNSTADGGCVRDRNPRNHAKLGGQTYKYKSPGFPIPLVSQAGQVDGRSQTRPRLKSEKE